MSKQKFKGLTLILLIIILTITTVYAEDNSTSIITDAPDNIKTFEDTQNEVDNVKTFEDMQNAIDNAEEHDIINLNGTYVSSGKEINISKSLTIQGTESSTIIDANNLSGIFRITSESKNVTFKNLIFINSKTKDIEKKYQTIPKSAIYSPQTDINLINCTLNSNNGRLVYSQSLTCINSTVCNNIAEEYLIYSYNTYFSDCNFIKNNIQNDMIYVEGIGNYKTNILNCNLKNNTLKKYNSLVNIQGSCANILNSNFTNNTAQTLNIESEGKNILINCNFENNYWEAYLSGNSYIENCSFISNLNTALSLSYYVYPGADPETELRPSNSVILNSIFKSNLGTALNSWNNLKISNSIFENNDGEYAGSIIIKGSTATVTNCSLINNSESSVLLSSNINYYLNKKYEGKLTIDGKQFTKSVILNDNLTKIEIIKVIVKPVTTTYYSGEKLKITLINKKTGKAVKNTQIELKVYAGKKTKTYYLFTNSNGIATFDASKLLFGYHKLEITSDYGNCKIPKTTTSIKVKKAKTIIKAPKITARYKKSKYFRVTVINKATKKVIKNTYITIKIDKKTYKIKTNYKGIVKINTKRLKIGKHTVVISSGDSNYQMNAKSIIKIKK